MNPVTRHLLDRVADPGLAELAIAWDSFEGQVVSIFRTGSYPTEAARDYDRCRRRASRAHRAWARSLEPHWRSVRIGGVVVTEDPFRRALELPSGGLVVGNRDLMRVMPAAREALNGLLLERGVVAPPGEI